MALYFTALNSGSNANCYYIGNNDEAVLIDAGLNCREMERRMERLNLSISSVKAIFISHEHSDHISGLSAISKKYDLPVYITPLTFANCSITLKKELINSFTPGMPVTIGNLLVMALKKSHDAADPHSFVVSNKHINIGIFTDIGFAGKEVISYFKQCHAAFLETNYCDDMLQKGGYPAYLKKRISSRKGHLSNIQALEIFNKYRSKELAYLILSHLSENNNTPEVVDKLFSTYAGATKIIIASRYEETPVFCLENNAVSKKLRPKWDKETEQIQLSLF